MGLNDSAQTIQTVSFVKIALLVTECEANVLLVPHPDPHDCLFVCVEVLRPSQPNGVMSSAVS